MDGGVGFRGWSTGCFQILWVQCWKQVFYITLPYCLILLSPPPSPLVAALVLNEPSFIGFTYVITDKAAAKFHFFSPSLSLFSLVPSPLGSRFNTRELDSGTVYTGWARLLFLQGRTKLERKRAKWHKAGNKRDGRTDKRTSCCYCSCLTYTYCTTGLNPTWRHIKYSNITRLRSG